MPKFTLTAEWDENLKVTHEFNEETLDDVVMQFENFLRGCGFYYEGILGVCDEPSYDSVSMSHYDPNDVAINWSNGAYNGG